MSLFYRSKQRRIEMSDAKNRIFADWYAKVSEIAAREGLEPKANPLPGELDVWVFEFEAGKTPAQAWASVPYKKRW